LSELSAQPPVAPAGATGHSDRKPSRLNFDGTVGHECRIRRFASPFQQKAFNGLKVSTTKKISPSLLATDDTIAPHLLPSFFRLESRFPAFSGDLNRRIFD
jgi:hypothetical protein